ncbi:MAG TPA: ATP-binding protein, partial [Tepidiformaceae bacterium]|nr:ATP-binding protein [Tepidiformaceae bacterium]
NNLLTVITGYSAMMLAGLPDGDPNREGLEAIHLAGSRATELTAQLLAFGRRSVLQPRVVDINEVIRETEQMLRRTIGEDIMVVSVLDPSLPAVEVDSGQIGQVIMNLAINARDAMPHGGKLTIETEEFVASTAVTLRSADLPPGTYVRISVTDSGEGMHPEVRDRVFEPFFTTKPAGRGTGLGLSVVHGIIKQSGGSIHVYSEPGQGTTFTIYLPAVGGGRSAGDRPAADDAVQVSRAETILIAEDEEGVRGIVQRILEREGYRVILAGDGESALEVLRDEPSIALLISDVVMPGMNGRELAEQASLIRPDIPVLFISGYPDDAIVRSGILSAEVDFLQKPFTPDGLLRKVGAALQK